MLDGYDFSSLSAMIVDGNEFMGRVLGTVLRSMRITQPRDVRDVPTALKELQVRTPDVIFIDNGAHEYTGLRFIKLIRRSDNPARHCPIILLSAHASERIVKAGRNAGADYTLIKPFSLTAIHRALVSLRNDERGFVQTATYYGPDRRRRNRPFEGAERRSAELARTA